MPHISDWIAVVALFLVFEGIAPFVNPRGMKRALAWVIAATDRELRIAGFCSMLGGLALLYWVH